MSRQQPSSRARAFLLLCLILTARGTQSLPSAPSKEKSAGSVAETSSSTPQHAFTNDDEERKIIRWYRQATNLGFFGQGTVQNAERGAEDAAEHIEQKVVQEEVEPVADIVDEEEVEHVAEPVDEHEAGSRVESGSKQHLPALASRIFGASHGSVGFDHHEGPPLLRPVSRPGVPSDCGFLTYPNGVQIIGKIKHGVVGGFGFLSNTGVAYPIYVGAMRDGLPNGRGVFFWRDDTADTEPESPPRWAYHNGYFQDGERHGAGLEYRGDGTVILGYWQNDWQMRGRAFPYWQPLFDHPWPKELLVYKPNPDVIIDADFFWPPHESTELVSGDADGEGVLEYADGREYRGALQHGKPHGDGVVTYPPNALPNTYGEVNELFEGSFKEGKPHGLGRRWLAGGILMSGNFVHRYLKGPATIKKPDGKVLSGIFKKTKSGPFCDSLRHGPWHTHGGGIKSGTIHWRHGIKHGPYSIAFDDGLQRSGQLEDGLKHGEWKVMLRNSKVRTKRYMRGRLDGLQTETFPDGRYVETFYEQGRILEDRPKVKYWAER